VLHFTDSASTLCQTPTQNPLPSPIQGWLLHPPRRQLWEVCGNAVVREPNPVVMWAINLPASQAKPLPFPLRGKGATMLQKATGFLFWNGKPQGL
jgi:hypothetical protein